MAFTEGDKNAGSKPGVNNFTKNKPWRDTLNRAILASDGQKLRSLAEALINKASEGDVAALKEIGDRIDGKVVQEIDASLEQNIIVEIVRFSDDE